MKNQMAVWELLLAMTETKVNLVDGHNNTALHWAAMYNRKEAAERLVKRKGIKLNLRNRRGFTPVMLAVRLGRREVLGVLVVTEGVDLWVRDGSGQSLEEGAGEGREQEWSEKEKREVVKMVEGGKKMREGRDSDRDVGVEVETTLSLVKQLLVQKISELELREEVVKKRKEKEESEKVGVRRKVGITRMKSLVKDESEESDVRMSTGSSCVGGEKEVEVLVRELERLSEGRVMERVREELVCGVCTGRCAQSVWQCAAGHIMCETCKEGGLLCPTCQGKVVGRTSVVENIIKVLN